MGSDAPCRKKHVPRARGDSYGQRRFIKRSSRPANAVGALATGFNPAGRLNLHLCAAPWAAGDSHRKRRFIKRSSPVRAVDSVGSNTFYGAGGLREAAAPQARIGCRLNPAGQPAFMPAPRARGIPMGSGRVIVREILWEAIPFYGAGLLLENLRPSGQRGVGTWLVRKPCVGLCGGQF